MDDIATRYVKLVLQVGQHDAAFVDAYYGDETWKPSGAPRPLTDLAGYTTALQQQLVAMAPSAGADEIVVLRHRYLTGQLTAVATRIAMLRGQRLTFDEESVRLYDAESPRTSEDEFKHRLEAASALLPGSDALEDRYARFRNGFVIPKDRLDRVFRAAIDGCRNRTLAHLTLPPGETFTIEYVTGKSWSAYNWYKGNFTSLIQVNTDLPITIDRALDLACHEGYPGHHVYNVLLEQHLVRERGWVEFSVYPLFSPQSLIAEGTANYGIDVAFPGQARTTFERETLYPLAGLNPETAERYAAVQRAVDALTYAGNEAARRYLNGQADRTQTAAFLRQWAMMPADRAAQRVKFFDDYRSYVINYNLGRDLVAAYIERAGGTPDQPAVRWREFGKLISSPRLPSGLK